MFDQSWARWHFASITSVVVAVCLSLNQEKGSFYAPKNTRQNHIMNREEATRRGWQVSATMSAILWQRCWQNGWTDDKLTKVGLGCSEWIQQTVRVYSLKNTRINFHHIAQPRPHLEPEKQMSCWWWGGSGEEAGFKRRLWSGGVKWHRLKRV